jgi:hypothetical protein
MNSKPSVDQSPAFVAVALTAHLNARATTQPRVQVVDVPTKRLPVRILSVDGLSPSSAAAGQDRLRGLEAFFVDLLGAAEDFFEEPRADPFLAVAFFVALLRGVAAPGSPAGNV